ncbi:MAG: hypothetical protein IPK16_28955 [Anaerolineales bacterium]|nr:hypothetical protein [Anaerolineales bacterium]
MTELRITAIDHADSRLIAVPMGQNQVLGRLIETGDGMGVRVALWQRLGDGSYTVVALYRVGYEDGAVALFGEFGPGGDGRGAIDDYHLLLSDDGAWIGYLYYDGLAPNTKLFVQPVVGRAAQRVDAADVAYARVIGFAMDPKSRYVVYNANQDGMGKDALYVSYFPDDLKLPVIHK